MNYATMYPSDLVNGEGVRTSLFVSGCTHHCKGCFNVPAQDFSYGEPYDDAVRKEVLKHLERPYVDGLTLLGGEPMEPSNQEALLPLIRDASEIGKTIWIYSGYTWEQLTDPKNERCRSSCTDEILSLIDVLVDGEFVLEEKDLSLPFRGSRNQRIIDVRKTRESGKVVLYDNF